MTGPAAAGHPAIVPRRGNRLPAPAPRAPEDAPGAGEGPGPPSPRPVPSPPHPAGRTTARNPLAVARPVGRSHRHPIPPSVIQVEHGQRRRLGTRRPPPRGLVLE